MSKLATLVFLCVTAASAAVQAAPTAPPAPSQPAFVAPTDSSVDSELVLERLAARRALNLSRLHAYALAGQFPQNHVKPGLLNVFIDEVGHICAVANLIHLDGENEMVKTTSATDNYIVLAKVTKGPLMDWMLTSGFTQEEIGQIQAPYSFIDEPQLIEPEPQPEPQLTQLEMETERVRTILLAVHKRLSKDTDKSLALAAQRLQTQPLLASSFGAQRRFAQAP
jgi:hypothetical protein